MHRNWLELGKQRCTLEGEAVHLQIYGELTAEELRALFVLFWQEYLRCGRLFLLLDCTHATGMGPDARRLLPELRRLYPIAGATLVFGASLPVRVLGMLITNSARLLRRDRTASPMLFFSSEAEAREWLARNAKSTT